MKVLHTSDWHLGQKFLNNARLAENEKALNWILQTIDNQGVEILLIVGDIFDTMNPPNYARTLYYNFLTKLEKTTCRHVIIIGGNHDSPMTLNAPRELLKTKNIHVIGCATEQLEDEIIELRDAKGNLEAVIAAVPFLRDSDIRKSVEGELFEDRASRIKLGIRNHYHRLATAMQHYEAFNVPIIATGHLFASKATDNKESKIYVGNLDNIDVNDFPTLFDYIALGHIHKAQRVYYNNKVRYSGSLIPLGFKEIEDVKSVYILDFKGRTFEKTTVIIPIARRLITIRGNYESVANALETLEIEKNTLTAWLEIVVETDKAIPNLNDVLQSFILNKNVEILKCRLEPITKKNKEITEFADLKSMSELEVFVKRLESQGLDAEEITTLTDTFNELLNLMQEQEEKE